MNNVFEIKLESIDLIEIPNRSLNDEYIESLITVGEFDRWPPVDIVEDVNEQGSYWLLNGHHRYTAAKLARRQTIKARIHPDNFNDNQIIIERFNNNRVNGLPLTTADRKEHAEWLKRICPQMTLAEISKQTGLSQATLSYHFNGVQRSAKPRTTEQEVRAFVRQIETLHIAGKGWFKPKARKKVFLAVLEDCPELAESFRNVGKALIEAADEFDQSES